MFPLTHWHSCALNGCSGGVQYSLIGIHVHSQVFRGCSILTQGHSSAFTSVQGVFSSDTNENFSWLHNGESCLIMTQRQSCALNGCSHLLNRSHEHSVGVQSLFPLTLWHHVHSMVQGGFNTHSLAFTHTHKCSRGVQYVFSLVMYLKAQ